MEIMRVQHAEFVVGLLFSQDLNQILLIRKNRPDWQKGKLNGPGGHIEEGENPWEAIVREFKEETGLEIPRNRWREICVLVDSNVVRFFTAYGDDIFKAETTTDEFVHVYPVWSLSSLVVEPLQWMIPLARLSFANQKSYVATVRI